MIILYMENLYHIFGRGSQSGAMCYIGDEAKSSKSPRAVIWNEHHD